MGCSPSFRRDPRPPAHGLAGVLAMGCALLALVACSSEPSSSSATDPTVPPSFDVVEPPEGSFVEGDAPVTPIGENPLSGAAPMPSLDAFVAAAQKEAADAGLAVAVVDPRPALGPDMTIWFTGVSAAFVTPDATVVESLGASGAPYLDNLVTKANEMPRAPGLSARRITDAVLDCAYLPGSDQDELLCGARGTAVEFRIRHSSTSDHDVERMARLVMPTVTWLNQSESPTPSS